MAKDTQKGTDAERSAHVAARGHIRFGWWTLAIFMALGLALESAHALKLDLYLNVGNETRRLMWTLAHAHGTLLGLLNLGFAATVTHAPEWSGRSRQLASRALLIATILIPAGFFLGGIIIHSGDPGLGVLLVPPGALLAIFASVLVARSGVRK